MHTHGDLETGPHHTVEDTGLALGQAIDEALGDRAGIRRFGASVVPMDEARARLRDRHIRAPIPGLRRRLPGERAWRTSTRDLAEEFLRAVAPPPSSPLHLRVEAGHNAHHMVEACFKAFARALREAVEIDPRVQGVPSTKGLL